MANGRLSDRQEGLWARIKRVALTDVGALMRGLNAEDLEKMERVLIEADFGVAATVELTQALEDEVRRGDCLVGSQWCCDRLIRQRAPAVAAWNDSVDVRTDGAGDRIVAFERTVDAVAAVRSVVFAAVQRDAGVPA